MELEMFENEIEEDIEVEIEKDFTIYNLKIKENIFTIHMKIKEYLYENSESDLLAYWNFYDTAEYIYDSTYLSTLDTNIY